MGHTALARGDSGAAYKAMLEHERRFPQGKLAEERDAIRIQALVGLGQPEAARLRADAFRKRYPESLLRPAVEHAVTENPRRP
jgi:outer membrane protein assembly factor BamD (BamD/ComL family)